MSSESAQKNVRDSIKRLIETEILGRVDEWYEGTGAGIPGLMRKFGEARLLELPPSTARSGQDPEFGGQLLLAEELGRVKCVSLVGALAVQAQFATRALARHASADVQGEFLAPAVAGQRIAGRQCSAGGARPRAATGQLHARRDGGDYLLTGSGLRVANATASGWMCLDCEDPHAGGASTPLRVLVPGDLPGVSILAAATDGGPIAGYVSEVSLESVRVPRRFLIRAESPQADRDHRDEDRLFAATLYLSRIEEIIAFTGDSLRSGRRCGRATVSVQLLGASLAEMQTEVASARALIGQAVRECQAGSGDRLLVLMARHKVAQLARTAPNICLKIWGKFRPGVDNLIFRMQEDMCRHALDGSRPEMLVREIARHLGFGVPARERGTPASTSICGAATQGRAIH